MSITLSFRVRTVDSVDTCLLNLVEDSVSRCLAPHSLVICLVAPDPLKWVSPLGLEKKKGFSLGTPQACQRATKASIEESVPGIKRIGPFLFLFPLI